MTNRLRTLAFRDDVVLFLRENGIGSAARHPSLSGLKLSERLRTDTGDIEGLPWALSVRRQKTINLSESLSMAAGKACAAGTPLYAAVHHRKGHSTRAAYVTMPLSVFIEVLRMTPGTEASAQ